MGGGGTKAGVSHHQPAGCAFVPLGGAYGAGRLGGKPLPLASMRSSDGTCATAGCAFVPLDGGYAAGRLGGKPLPLASMRSSDGTCASTRLPCLNRVAALPDDD
jgi:hypothetical protein